MLGLKALRVEGDSRLVRLIVCDDCGARETVRASTDRGGRDSTELRLREYFKRRGWLISQRGRATCPDCASSSSSKVVEIGKVGKSTLIAASAGTYQMPDINLPDYPIEIPPPPDARASAEAPRAPSTPIPTRKEENPPAASVEALPAYTEKRIPEVTNETASTPKKKRFLSPREIVKVVDLLREHLDTSGDDGLVDYRKGWSDDRIAKEIGPDINDQNIGRIRADVFGQIRSARGRRKDPKDLLPNSLRNRVVRLQASVDVLKVENVELKKRIEILEGAILGPNK